jgi:hypothetical protein
MGIKQDLTGQKFGKLTVVSQVEHRGQNIAWLCVCDCGKETIATSGHLRSGARVSCGCRRGETKNKYNTKHNRVYSIWRGMKERCYYERNKRYKEYGGRGIKVCSEWHNFAIFQEWALSNGYSSELTLDRIDNNGNYCPENCRWATITEQANNKIKSKIIEYEGKRMTLAQWCKLLSLPYFAIYQRLYRNWTFENAIKTPLDLQDKRPVKKEGYLR